MQLLKLLFCVIKLCLNLILIFYALVSTIWPHLSFKTKKLYILGDDLSLLPKNKVLLILTRASFTKAVQIHGIISN